MQPGKTVDSWLQDIFTLNLANSDFQKELLKETLKPAQCVELAINLKKRETDWQKKQDTNGRVSGKSLLEGREISYIENECNQNISKQSSSRPNSQNQWIEVTNRCGSWWLQSSSNHKASSAPLEKTSGNCGGKTNLHGSIAQKKRPITNECFKRKTKAVSIW